MDFTYSIPECGRMCINNMLGQFASFGCSSAADVTCLCGDPRFGYGLRDCTIQACGQDVFAAVQSFGNSVCQGKSYREGEDEQEG